MPPLRASWNPLMVGQLPAIPQAPRPGACPGIRTSLAWPGGLVEKGAPGWCGFAPGRGRTGTPPGQGGALFLLS